MLSTVAGVRAYASNGCGSDDRSLPGERMRSGRRLPVRIEVMNTQDAGGRFPTMTVPIEARGLTQSFGFTPVLRAINLRVAPGAGVLICGRNGADSLVKSRSGQA